MSALVEQAPVYRSKDETFIADIRDAIMLNKAFSMTDRKRSYDYIGRYVFLDDLHKWAIGELGKMYLNDPVDMGHGTLSPRLVLVTYDRPTKEEWAIQDSIVTAMGYNLQEVYRTWLNKSTNCSVAASDIYHKVLESEVRVLQSPNVVSFGLFFGGMTGDRGDLLTLGDSRVVVTRQLEDVLLDDDNIVLSHKHDIWSHISTLLS